MIPTVQLQMAPKLAERASNSLQTCNEGTGKVSAV